MFFLGKLHLTKNKRLLNRFVRQVRSNSDTPSLIQLIAADADYLALCLEIVNDSAQRQQESVKPIKAVCQTHGFEFRSLQEMLMPAARALGLALSSNAQLDYYALLGISPEADISEIKKAFREKAYDVHPDTRAQDQPDNDQFVRLNTAYQTLSNPVLRGHYNLSRRNLIRWYENPIQASKPNRAGRKVFIIQWAVLFILLVFGIFVFDLFFP